jgi:hypothetical protein
MLDIPRWARGAEQSLGASGEPRGARKNEAGLGGPRGLGGQRFCFIIFEIVISYMFVFS